jgi:hypothetical protein
VVGYLDRPAVRPANFLTINKQVKQLGEVAHGCELVVKPDLERPGAVTAALLGRSLNRNLLLGCQFARRLEDKLAVSVRRGAGIGRPSFGTPWPSI